jgi:hypothetical protein
MINARIGKMKVFAAVLVVNPGATNVPAAATP